MGTADTGHHNQHCVRVESAVALMQFTPVTQPASVANGTYNIVNLNSGLVCDCLARR